jgi:hypothetical protein
MKRQPRFFASEALRALLRGKPKQGELLRRLRRKALRSSDARMARACLLQLALDASGDARLRLLRAYVAETGSPFAAHVLSEEYNRLRRHRAAALTLTKMRFDADDPVEELQAIAAAFHYPLPPLDARREYLKNLRLRARHEGTAECFRWATIQLIALERNDRRFAHALRLAIELAERDRSPLALQLVALVREDLGDAVSALRTYEEAAALAKRLRNYDLHRSLVEKIKRIRC